MRQADQITIAPATPGSRTICTAAHETASRRSCDHANSLRSDCHGIGYKELVDATTPYRAADQGTEIPTGH